MKDNVYNISKLAFHKEKLESFIDNEVTPPVYVRIKPTNICDHSCTYCSYNPENECPVSETINSKDQIPREKMLEILSDFKDMGVKAITYSGGGEPLIYPDIIEIMNKTLESGIDLSIITNGQRLSGERADILRNAKWVRISASESDPVRFEKTRRRPKEWFYDLRENISKFAKEKNNDCEFGINFVVHNGNHDSVYDSAKYFRDLGVNHIKITPCYNSDFVGYHKNTKESVIEQIESARKNLTTENFTVYDTYENDFNLTGLSERNYSKCFVMQLIPVIGADSVVYFCHDKTYAKNGALGSLKDRSFKNLWYSNEARKLFDEFDPKKSCKHHCTYDSRNILAREMMDNMDKIENYKPSSDKHKNFI